MQNEKYCIQKKVIKVDKQVPLFRATGNAPYESERAQLRTYAKSNETSLCISAVTLHSIMK